MRTFAAASAVAVLVLGCAGARTTAAPDVRQALAPTGRLRVALVQGAPANVVRDPASGEMRGVGHDLGREMARRLGVPFEPVFYPSVGALIDAGRTASWDVTFNGVTAERRTFLDTSAPHLELEFGYLVPAGSRIAALADVDRPGVRVTVPEKGAADTLLTRTLTQATLVRAAGLPGCLDAMRAGRADVFAANKANLFQVMPDLPGSRVLDGRFGVETQAMLVPKGRDAGLAWARRFVDDAKSSGLVKAALERAGLRGAIVAP